jgi:DNA-binding phage protein
MSLFKRAYVRGVNDELIRLGLARYPVKEAADEIADAVGDQLPVEPSAEPVSPETAADVAATLVDAANKLVSETQGEGLGSEGEQELKTSAAQDLETRAGEQAYHCMLKVAEEVKAAEGSTIEGGDKGNSPAGAAASETQMENANRPEGYANVGVTGVGGTSSGAGRGTGVIGKEQPQPAAPKESPGGSNSVVQQSKMGSLAEIIRKVAMAKHAEGSTIEGGDKGNTMAGATASETKMEERMRPEGYAHLGRPGMGDTDLQVPAGANVGVEQAHPKAPAESPAGALPPSSANSIVENSKTSGEDPFLALFKKTAEEIANFLPATLTSDDKIAHVRRMMGMTPEERSQYLGIIAKEAGATDDQAFTVAEKHAAAARRRYQGNPGRQDRTRANQKTAGELPPALRAAIEKKKDEKGEGKDESEKHEEHEKKESPEYEAREERAAKEEGKEEKKEGADLLSRIRGLSHRAAQ